MIELVLVLNRNSGNYEVVRLPKGTGWIGEVIKEFPTLGEAKSYIADFLELIGR